MTAMGRWPSSPGGGTMIGRATARGGLRLPLAVTLALALAGCANQPKTPEWQLNASSGLDRVRDAYFTGDARGAADEFALVRREIARTGRPALLARAELVRCALRTASLVVEACAGFESLRADADPAERAYAEYLQGRAGADQASLLPEAHGPLARPGTAASDLAALDRMAEPLSRLVGASVLLQTGRGTREVVQRAVDAASAQGWPRPLRAWLQVQLHQAQAAGDAAEAERIGRRLALLSADLATAAGAAPAANAAPAPGASRATP